MKSKKIQRGILSPHARKSGDAPILGHVSRVRDSKGKEKRRGKGGGARSDDGRRVNLMWSMAFAAVALVVIGGFVVFWLRSRKVEVTVDGDVRLEEDVRIVSKFVSPSEDAALDLVKRALANRDPAKVDGLFRTGDAKPAEVIEFMQGIEGTDGRVERIEWLSSMDMAGLQMDGVLVVYEKKDSQSERLACLVPDEKGNWKMDFEGFARSSRPPWKDLLQGRSDHAQVRVFLARDSYYNGLYYDESKWACYAFIAPEATRLLPDGMELMFGYCKLGSPQERSLRKIFETGVQFSRATLVIRKQKESDERQFEISRVLSEDWVLPPKSVDESFK